MSRTRRIAPMWAKEPESYDVWSIVRDYLRQVKILPHYRNYIYRDVVMFPSLLKAANTQTYDEYKKKHARIMESDSYTKRYEPVKKRIKNQALEKRLRRKLKHELKHNDDLDDMTLTYNRIELHSWYLY